jgi:hypothetical protein
MFSTLLALRPQSFANDRRAPFARFAVWAFHGRCRRTQTQFAKSRQNLDIIVKTALLKFAPTYGPGGIFPNQPFPVFAQHPQAPESLMILYVFSRRR